MGSERWPEFRLDTRQIDADVNRWIQKLLSKRESAWRERMARMSDRFQCSSSMSGHCVDNPECARCRLQDLALRGLEERDG